MKEYEYSFKVKNIDHYIKYCQDNDFQLESESYQIREVFKNKNKILARITTDIKNNKKICVLDFKDDNEKDVLLKEAKESLPLTVNKNNYEAVLSILEILGYYKDIVLKRNRLTYIKESIKFEIDEYMEPEKCFVVAIEGDKELVDYTYNDICKKIAELI
jgi:adenylate cyclase class IV